MFEVSFREAMAKAGLVSHEALLADGRLHRFHVKGDRQGTKNGWYVLHGDGTPAGVYGSWKHGVQQTWSFKSLRSMTAAEKAEYSRKIDMAQKARKAEKREKREEARRRADYIWCSSRPAPDDHPYLVKKGVHSHGLRVFKSALVIPLRDEFGTLHSLQFIDATGNKRFLRGGRKSGCYFSIGRVADTICICEGYATAASVHESTSFATACAFDAGNLEAVAKVLQRKFPSAKIIICADDDTNTVGNPGIKYARIAAKAINGHIAIAEMRS